MSDEQVITAFVASDEFFFPPGSSIQGWLDGLPDCLRARSRSLNGFRNGRIDARAIGGRLTFSPTSSVMVRPRGKRCESPLAGGCPPAFSRTPTSPQCKGRGGTGHHAELAYCLLSPGVESQTLARVTAESRPRVHCPVEGANQTIPQGHANTPSGRHQRIGGARGVGEKAECRLQPRREPRAHTAVCTNHSRSRAAR